MGPLSFTPLSVPAQVSRPAVCTNGPVMGAETNTRRELFAKTGAALLGAAFVDSASAKAGQFGKVSIFGVNDLSSPYNPGGPKAGPDATFGFSKSEGPMLATGYESDVAREKAAFVESSKLISSLQPKIDSKTWWYCRDELRLQAYKKYWTEVASFDLALTKKEPALAQKEYEDVLAALKVYTDTAVQIWDEHHHQGDYRVVPRCCE